MFKTAWNFVNFILLHINVYTCQNGVVENHDNAYLRQKKLSSYVLLLCFKIFKNGTELLLSVKFLIFFRNFLYYTVVHNLWKVKQQN